MNRVSVLAGLLTIGVLGGSTLALAADPSQGDFDACNRMAQAKMSSPSASPQSQTQSPSPATQQAAPSPQSASQARVENQADQLRGIADSYKDDATYQQSYRDCMKGRGF
jgi:hypothetical protein